MEKTTSKIGTTIEPFMIKYINKIYGTGLNSAKIAEYINFEFALNISEKDVNLYFEPSLQEDMEDVSMIYKNAS